MFDKKSFFDANDRSLEKVETPEWEAGGLPVVYIRTMSGAERDTFEANLFPDGVERPTMENYRARLLVRCIADETGNRLFGDEDAALLGGKSVKVLDRLIEVARRLNAVSKKDVEESVKN